MKILGGIRGNTADGYFRITAPFSALRYSTQHQFRVRKPALGDAQEFDMLWLQRHCEPIAEIIAREFKDAGKPVIYDVDDWLFGMPPSWSCYDNYYGRGTGRTNARLIFHERMMRLADVVTCPTEFLAQKLRERLANPSLVEALVPGWENPPPVVVLPNCILQADWDIVLPLEVDLEGPVVGWFGFEYHWDNLKAIAQALDVAIQAIDGNLVILGFPEIVNCFSKRLAARTHVQPAVSWKNFATMRCMIAALDVGIAWLEDTDFNRCKSSLKALQYGAAGVPVVASDVVYSEVMTSSVDGLLALTPRNLTERILCLVREREMAGSFAETWREKIWQKHSYERQAQRWLALIESFLPEVSSEDGQETSE